MNDKHKLINAVQALLGAFWAIGSLLASMPGRYQWFPLTVRQLWTWSIGLLLIVSITGKEDNGIDGLMEQMFYLIVGAWANMDSGIIYMLPGGGGLIFGGLTLLINVVQPKIPLVEVPRLFPEKWINPSQAVIGAFWVMGSLLASESILYPWFPLSAQAVWSICTAAMLIISLFGKEGRGAKVERIIYSAICPLPLGYPHIMGVSTIFTGSLGGGTILMIMNLFQGLSVKKFQIPRRTRPRRKENGGSSSQGSESRSTQQTGKPIKSRSMSSQKRKDVEKRWGNAKKEDAGDEDAEVPTAPDI